MTTKRFGFQSKVALARVRDGQVERRTSLTLATLVILGLIAVYLWMPRWPQYPVITHPEADLLVRQLYTACSSRDDQRLAAAGQRFQALVEGAAISPAERQAFERIFDMAKAGNWDIAAKASLRFAEDQVGRAKPFKAK
jgi:hypothetical protein